MKNKENKSVNQILMDSFLKEFEKNKKLRELEESQRAFWHIFNPFTNSEFSYCAN